MTGARINNYPSYGSQRGNIAPVMPQNAGNTGGDATGGQDGTSMLEDLGVNFLINGVCTIAFEKIFHEQCPSAIKNFFEKVGGKAVGNYVQRRFAPVIGAMAGGAGFNIYQQTVEQHKNIGQFDWGSLAKDTVSSSLFGLDFGGDAAGRGITGDKKLEESAVNDIKAAIQKAHPNSSAKEIEQLIGEHPTEAATYKKLTKNKNFFVLPNKLKLTPDEAQKLFVGGTAPKQPGWLRKTGAFVATHGINMVAPMAITMAGGSLFDNLFGNKPSNPMSPLPAVPQQDVSIPGNSPQSMPAADSSQDPSGNTQPQADTGYSVPVSPENTQNNFYPSYSSPASAGAGNFNPANSTPFAMPQYGQNSGMPYNNFANAGLYASNNFSGNFSGSAYMPTPQTPNAAAIPGAAAPYYPPTYTNPLV